MARYIDEITGEELNITDGKIYTLDDLCMEYDPEEDLDSLEVGMTDIDTGIL